MTKARDLASNSTGSKPTLVDAKGDLLVGTAADTAGRLVVGSNGDTLVADSSTTTGLRWTGTPSASNPILNSSFDIWQRGTSIATGAGYAYGADRWETYRGSLVAGSTVSRQSVGDTTNLPFIQFCARVQRDSGNTGTQGINFGQNLETTNSIPFAGRTITLSFYARAGANYSSTSNALNAFVYSGTGTDQNYGKSWTGLATPVSGTATLTTTWQRFSYTGTVAATATQLAVYFQNTPTGTAGAADFYELTGVQIDIGSVALPFRRSSATLAGELAACQRYYSKSYVQTDAPATASSAGAISLKVASNTVANSEQYGSVFLPVTMRTNPTVTIYSYNGATSKVSDPASGTDFASNSGNAAWIGQNSFMVINNSGGTLTTTRFSVLLHYVASAEL